MLREIVESDDKVVCKLCRLQLASNLRANLTYTLHIYTLQIIHLILLREAAPSQFSLKHQARHREVYSLSLKYYRIEHLFYLSVLYCVDMYIFLKTRLC